MKFLDLFSGIGGFRFGLEEAGHECVGFCEIDKFARESYKAIHNTEGELEYHDITTITNEEFRKLRGKVDIIAGGFPCQSFSIAGKREGFSDTTRGTLFFDIARAAEEIKPSYLFLENVKGLFSHDKGNTFRVVIQTLDEMGYVVEWGLFNSKYWGVPQSRERVFIIATRKDVFKAPILFDLMKQQEVNGVTKKIRDVLEDKVDEKFYMSEEKTRGLIEKLTSLETKIIDVSQMKREGTPREYHDIAPTLAQRDYKEPRMVGMIDIKGNESIRRVYDPDGINPTLTTMGGGHREPKIIVAGNIHPSGRGMNGQVYQVEGGLSPTLNTNKGEGLKIIIDDAQGFDGIKTYEDATPTLKSSRSGLKVALPAIAVSRGRDVNDGKKGREQQLEINEKGISNSLTSVQKDNYLLQPNYRIRKLTPRECWRLQGFPEWAFEKAQDVNSNSQLYRQAGNSVTVNVIKAIAEKIGK